MNCFTHAGAAAVGVCGAAIGLGLSVGGPTVGAVAFGGQAVGWIVAVGAAAVGPAVINGQQCAEATRELVVRWFGSGALPPACRGSAPAGGVHGARRAGPSEWGFVPASPAVALLSLVRAPRVAPACEPRRQWRTGS
jgi:hypothetical protein